MYWVNIALLSAIIMGVVNIFDSHLLSKRMPGLRVYLLPVGLIQLVYAFIFFVMFPLPEGIGILPITAALASAALRTAAVLIMLYNLKKEEVSQVIPVVYTYPIFVAIMAMPLLGESLSQLQWLAIIMVVAGAVMVSVKQSPSGLNNWHAKLLVVLLCSSLLFAVADILSKYALAYVSAWNLFWLSAFLMCGLFIIMSISPGSIRQLIDMKQRNSTMCLLAFNETLAPIGMVLLFLALGKGPVSLVSTISSSRPMFVLLFAIILSRLSPTFLKWQFGKWILALRIIATAMIVGGLTIIHVT